MMIPEPPETPALHAPAVIDAVWRDLESHGTSRPAPLPPLDPDVDQVWIVLAPPRPTLRVERTH